MAIRVPGRHEQDLTKLTQAIQQIAQGRLNCAGTFTLAASATTTTVKAPTVAPGTIIVLMPQTANAAAALGSTYIQAANVAQGQFVVNHASAASVDRTFGFIAIG